MKKTIYLVITMIIFIVVFSCKKKDTVVYSDTAVVSAFYVKSHFSNDAKNYTFVIDEENKLIYNPDSFAYGMRVDSLTPVVAPKFKDAVIDGEISLSGSDTVWIDFRTEHVLTVTASDQQTKQSYVVRVNVHKVDPDSFVFVKMDALDFTNVSMSKSVMTEEGIVCLMNKGGELAVAKSVNSVSWEAVETQIEISADELDLEHATVFENGICIMSGLDIYKSTNGAIWEKEVTTSDFRILHLLFNLGGKLYALGDGHKIMRLNGNKWEVANEADRGFPVRGEAVCVGKSPTGIEVAYVAGGIDSDGNYLSSVWSTENGSYWVNLSLRENSFGKRAYASLIQYASGLIMIGGENADTIVADDFLYSQDYGINWSKVDTTFKLDTAGMERIEYVERCMASLLADEIGNIYIIGGRFGNAILGDAWKGRLNRAIPGFKK